MCQIASLWKFNRTNHWLDIGKNLCGIYLPLGVRRSVRFVAMNLLFFHKTHEAFFASNYLFRHCPGKELPFHPFEYGVILLDSDH